LHAGALALARRGLRVFPVWASRVEGDASSGKIPIPKGWNQKATTDESQINIWWRQRWRHKDRMVYTPHANIGIACGEGSNLAVVDLDHRPDEGKNFRGEEFHHPEQEPPAPRDAGKDRVVDRRAKQRARVPQHTGQRHHDVHGD
jgi:hypothetical protein